jgi:glycosyltransferase involved in cell wall biosynthesis
MVTFADMELEAEVVHEIQASSAFDSPAEHRDELRVLILTSEWPTPESPEDVPFIVRQVEFLRRARVHVDVFAFHGGKHPANYAKAWKQARMRLGSGRYDLIHAQFGQSGVLALPKTLPLVVTFRGDDLEGIIGPNGNYMVAGWFLRRASQLVAHAADEIIVVSETFNRYLPRRPYHVIPSGLDLSSFRPMSQQDARHQLNLPMHRRLVLFSADPRRARKRHWLAQAAIEQLKDEYDVELVIAKNVPHERMPLYMNACDALVLSSMHEGSPNVVKEALACNLPVISTDVGDVRLRIGHIEGCAVVPGTPEAFSEALRTVLQRDKRIDGRRTVMELDETLLTQRVIQIYQQALANKSRR